MAIDRARAALAVDELLRALGRDPTEEPLVGTAQRVADAWADDLLAGYGVDVAALLVAESFPSHTTDAPWIVLRDLDVATMCPHHLLPAVGKATVILEPGARLVGIGALGEVVTALARRLTLQEDIATGVVQALMTHLEARGAACFLRLRHGCMVARGSRQHAEVDTLAVRGSLDVRGESHALLAALLSSRG